MLVGMSVLVEMSVRVTSRQTHINVLIVCTHSDKCTELQSQLSQLSQLVEKKKRKRKLSLPRYAL